ESIGPERSRDIPGKTRLVRWKSLFPFSHFPASSPSPAWPSWTVGIRPIPQDEEDSPPTNAERDMACNCRKLCSAEAAHKRDDFSPHRIASEVGAVLNESRNTVRR